MDLSIREDHSEVDGNIVNISTVDRTENGLEISMVGQTDTFN